MIPYVLAEDGVSYGDDVEVIAPGNIYRCKIGDHVRIGPFVEIQQDVEIGDYCKIGSHTFICAGTEIGAGCFIGHGVMFCNDKWPRSWRHESVERDGEIIDECKLKGPDDWKCDPPIIESNVSIGSGAVILPGVRIREGTMIGAGAVVTQDTSARDVRSGNPARRIGYANPWDRTER